MYKEKTQEWMRHLDFIVIDLLMLLLAFALAYLSRYDIHIQNKDIYVSLALILLLLDFAVMIIGGTTPTLSLYEQIRTFTDIPIHILFRPRFGDFLYTEDELKSLYNTFYNIVKDDLQTPICRP